MTSMKCQCYLIKQEPDESEDGLLHVWVIDKATNKAIVFDLDDVFSQMFAGFGYSEERQREDNDLRIRALVMMAIKGASYDSELADILKPDGVFFVQVSGSLVRETDDAIFLHGKYTISATDGRSARVTEEFIENFSRDMQSFIEQQEAKYKIRLDSDREDMGRIHYDTEEMTQAQALYYFAAWKAGILERASNSGSEPSGAG